VTIAIVAAQYVFPSWPGFHTWQYAGLLAILAMAIGAELLALRGTRAQQTTGAIVAYLGVAAVLVSGLASGLLGPDSVRIVRSPGTVMPLPDLGVAAFFPNLGGDAIANGSGAVTVRKRDGSSFDIRSGERRVVGAYALEVETQTAAFVSAKTLAGNHLTITQPQNPAFLSPVLLFPQTAQIVGRTLPTDGFAIPALHRQVKVVLFTPDEKQTAGVHGAPQKGVLFAVDDDSGRLIPGGIALAKYGAELPVGGVVLRADVGTYPVLVVSPVPSPLAFILGIAGILAGIAVGTLRPGRLGPPRAVPAQRIVKAP